MPKGETKMIEAKELQQLMIELGIPCLDRQVQDTPSYIVYHFELVDITQLTQVEKKAKFLSAYLHTNVVIKNSTIAHFSISIPKEEQDKVKFYDKKYDKLFNKVSESRAIFTGITEKGEPFMLPIEQTPHILVAGTTGSGKSIMLNNIICSIMRNSLPATTQFVMIDTKRVELSQYKKIKYSGVCKVANDFTTAIEFLKDVCQQMEARYYAMEQMGIRKIPDSYPKIVVVIEELNDLMLVSKKKVEEYIVRIAQLGRACGIHLVIATQYPVVACLTGAIKANIGCRIALQTTSASDSVNILGHKGAELLRGKGDCLLKLPTQPEEIHLQSPYLSDEDIERTINEF